MVYSGGDGSIIGLISHIWRRNGSELLLDLIYGFEKFEEPPDLRIFFLVRRADHTWATSVNYINTKFCNEGTGVC